MGAVRHPLGSNGTAADALKDRAREESLDTHLRGTEEVAGYHTQTIDGEIGHVDSCSSTSISRWRHATDGREKGASGLGGTEKLVGLVIESAPGYDELQFIAREYEARLYVHYSQPPYWLPENELHTD